MSDDVVIKADGLWKRYGLPLGPAVRRFSRRVRGQSTDNPDADGPWALRDLNFEVKRGETLGIIGRNGAGKSTLLKVLAGVTPPTRGHVHVAGTIFPMIELNAGLHFELTGRENVRLLGAVMGLNRAEIGAKMPQIESFCELGEWFDRPVRKYSSGMLTRLGFAVAVNVDADILLVDEVLSVGDIAFQRKCFREIEEIRNSGKNVLLVSHSIRQIERLCDRALLLDSGKLVSIGDVGEVVSNYYGMENSRVIEQRFSDGQTARVLQYSAVDNPAVDILGVRLLDKNEQESHTFYTGEPLTIEITYQSHERIDEANVGLAISTIDSLYLSGFTNENVGVRISLDGVGTFRCKIISLPLLAGIYTIEAKIQQVAGGVLARNYGLAVFSVMVPASIRVANDYGVVMMDTQWEVVQAGGTLSADNSR